jgi:rhamnulokinase
MGNWEFLRANMSSASFLAFDLGAASGRAILGQLESGRLYIKEIHRFTNAMLAVRGRLHWDILRLLEEMKKSLAIAAQETQIGSFAIDTWGVDFGLLDRDGKILGLPFAYRDTHTQGAMEKFFGQIPRERIYFLTGIQFLTFNSLFQLFVMKKDDPALFEQAHDLLFMPDLFYYFLTGEKKTEFTFATTSQLYNPRKMEWEKELFDALGISRSLMQEVVQPGVFIGNLDVKISCDMGRRDIPAVAVATHDTASAVASVPSQRKDWAFISSGTWSLMGIEIEEPIINNLALRLNFTNEGGVGGTFRFLKNITGLWLVQKCREAWKTKKQFSYDQLMSMAQEATSYRFFVDPDWDGFLNPENMPKAIQSYCIRTEQKRPRSYAEFVRGICESLALKYRYVLDEIRQLSPIPIRKIHIIGGGVKNRVLCQFTANATGLPVVAGPAEAASIGNIMMQSKAHGDIPSLSRMREVISGSFEFSVYEPMQTNEWEMAYERFQRLLSTEYQDDKDKRSGKSV